MISFAVVSGILPPLPSSVGTNFDSIKMGRLPGLNTMSSAVSSGCLAVVVESTFVVVVVAVVGLEILGGGLVLLLLILVQPKRFISQTSTSSLSSILAATIVCDRFVTGVELGCCILLGCCLLSLIGDDMMIPVVSSATLSSSYLPTAGTELTPFPVEVGSYFIHFVRHSYKYFSWKFFVVG